jgi:hypothetical protein
MYAGAQSRWNSKGKIALMHGSVPNKGVTPQSLAQNRPRIGAGAFLIGKIRIQPRKDINMLFTIAVVLVILWLLGMVTAYTMGGLIHVLLVIAIVVVLLRVINGRSPL